MYFREIGKKERKRKKERKKERKFFLLILKDRKERKKERERERKREREKNVVVWLVCLYLGFTWKSKKKVFWSSLVFYVGKSISFA